MGNNDHKFVMPPDSTRAGVLPPASAQERADALVWARLALMGELEASLHGSRKALLALDLAGIERGTCEQAGLVRELHELLRGKTALSANARAGESGMSASVAPTAELKKQLRASAKRILELARLQAALLSRARWKLRVLANMLAGTSSTYGPGPIRYSARPALQNRRRV
jgi:hypothetical protein